MASLVREGRGRSKEARGRARAVPSVREVCLIAAREKEAAEGERLSWSGRVYRVEAIQGALSGPDPGPGGAGAYLYLAAVGERPG